MPQAEPLTVLGIETSCDETAAAVVRRSADGRGTILANVVRSQWAEHAAFGGVVPEIAARAHLECLDDLVSEALAQSGVALADLDAIAATAGPGLIGGLLVGMTFAKGLAIAAGKPLVAVNHLEGHALTAGLTDGLRPPYLMLLVSGGHTQTLAINAIADYRRIGTTIDDALGEAFDKTAKLLGLGSPGGPAVEHAARNGDPLAFALPRPMMGRAEPHFSFAGLKTAVRRAAEARTPLTDATVADICASFQAAVADCVIDRCRVALGDVRARGKGMRTLVAAGGVAANAHLRQRLLAFCGIEDLTFTAPPLALCTDNGAMIAWAAAERLAAGLADDGMAVAARARWPLDEASATVYGSGRLGGKA
ncbi:MAG: tRNA (adenosine(37)-N6)-threonylcarbamoyltransferase complex transferase subunit TsaD [Pseudomonadota bacterium]